MKAPIAEPVPRIARIAASPSSGSALPLAKRSIGVGTGEKVLVSCFICAMTMFMDTALPGGCACGVPRRRLRRRPCCHFTFRHGGEYIRRMDDQRVSVYSTDNRESLPVYPQDILHPTEKGEAEIHGGATQLPAELLELLVLVDGSANVGDIEQQLKHIAPDALRTHLRALLRDGLVRQATVEEETGVDLTSFFAASAGPGEPSRAPRRARTPKPCRANRRSQATGTTSASRAARFRPAGPAPGTRMWSS